MGHRFEICGGGIRYSYLDNAALLMRNGQKCKLPVHVYLRYNIFIIDKLSKIQDREIFDQMTFKRVPKIL